MAKGETKDERAARLAKQLRGNLRRRKAQAQARADLSGLDPKRTDTPLHRRNGRLEDDERSSEGS
ncbi:MAG: hypothetical protein AAFU55_09680 [Pseudomonadota bacterium]